LLVATLNDGIKQLLGCEILAQGANEVVETVIGDDDG
jgi:hypothetical protein